ncbi:MAG: mechanosensitive ion channel protein MscS [Microbacterium sp.]|nr:mechanosensitive ion channel protein MscS [Microbacterium sp.]
MKKPAPFLVYTVLRLLAFLVPLAILWFFFPIFREYWWLAAIFAALIGMSISMLFLRRPLTDASVRLAERRESRASGSQADADAEDQAVDATDSPDEPKA